MKSQLDSQSTTSANQAWFDGTARRPEGLSLVSRRNLLKAGLAGIGGLSLPALLQSEQTAHAGLQSDSSSGKSVILLWMAGGPSHIDTWDPKPDRPVNNRGPFDVIQTRQPGTIICDRLPLMADRLDKFSLLRSVDCRGSSHQPNMVMQTGNREAAPRTNPKGDRYPSHGSIVAKHCGPVQAGMPPYVAFQTHPTHIGYAGWLGKQYDPFIANNAAKLPIYTNVGKDTGRTSGADVFRLPSGLNLERLKSRQRLVADFDQLRRDLDLKGSMDAVDSYRQQAVDLLVGRRAQEAFDLSQEPDETRTKYGKHLWCQQALLARRLVEAGSRFVTLDLSYHPASGTWDNHGDNIPPYGGISRGLGPLLPLFDHLITTLVDDLEAKGLLDNTLVIAMGEFGRTPNMGTQGSTDGRNHWPVVMSMALAGGGLTHGQTIGSTESDGGAIQSRPITPGDLSATIYRYFGVPLETTYEDERNRPRYIVEDGQPIEELFS